MSLRLIVRPKLCTGCRTCEISCAFTHGKDGQPGQSRCLTLTIAQGEYVPMLCLQCDNAACVKSCPVAAIALDRRTEVIHLDQERCTRCQACVVACPFGNMHWDGAHVLKCDLCAGYGDNPRCAMFCPSGCLTVEPLVPDAEVVARS